MDAYFADRRLDPRGGGAQVLKSAVLLAWVVGAYVLLVAWSASPWTAVPLAVLLGLGLAGVGFGVMHDGGHESASSRRWVNRLHAAALDLIGGSSYFWHHKHNVVHHAFTNVDGVDDDIDSSPFLRLAPTQRHRWAHRFQHLYVVPLVGAFFATKWTLFDDFKSWVVGRVGSQRVARPRGLAAVGLVAGKLLFLGWAVVLPLALHPLTTVLPVFLLVAFVLGVVLVTTFQLAHAVEGTDFVAATPGRMVLERPFFEHQLATTADFAPGNRLLGWYLGGLNCQVEHHLFPRVSHRHYPALSEIVRATCRDHGVPYLAHATLWQALAAHWRFLRRMGAGARPAVVAPALALAA